MSSVLDTAPALWDPATGRIYTFMLVSPSGELVSAWGRETLPELVALGRVSPEAQILPQDEAFALSDAADRQRLCRGPEPITPERFDELLNCLPPQRWHRGESAESFRLSEAITGDIYTFAIRLGDKFFTLAERGSTTHQELVQMCAEALKTAAV